MTLLDQLRNILKDVHKRAEYHYDLFNQHKTTNDIINKKILEAIIELDTSIKELRKRIKKA